MTTISLWNNNTAYIKTTRPALAKVTTISLWNNNTAYNTMTRSTLAKVTTVSLWKDTAYITTVFLQVRTACQKFIPCVKFALSRRLPFFCSVEANGTPVAVLGCSRRIYLCRLIYSKALSQSGRVCSRSCVICLTRATTASTADFY